MHIDVYHDIPCPWCRIGKAHLETALQEWDGEAVTVSYQPFLLEQGLPKEGIPAREHYKAKFGPENVAPMFERVKRAGADVGLEFNFDAAIRAPSVDAHRLIWLAPDETKQAILDGLHQAYFSEGKNVADLEVLADIAAAAGLDRAVTLARLRSEDGKVETDSAIENAHRLGITGVPFFVLDNRYALSGAQPPRTILAAMRQAAEERAASIT